MMPNPRVAILGLNFSPEPTGISPYTASLAHGLHERGMPVQVLTAHPHYPAWSFEEGYGQWVRRENIAGVSLVRLRHYLPKKPVGLARLVSEVSFGLRLLLTHWGKPDVVVLVSPALFATAIALFRARLFSLTRPAIVVWVQDLYSLGVTETGIGGNVLTRIMKWIESTTLKAATGVVVIHPQFATYISERLGVPPEKIEVIRNWTHLKKSPKTDVTAVRAQYGWANDDTVLLHSGNIGIKQGLENVVNAARIASSRQLPLRFVLVGDGNQRESLEESARGISHIQFVPSLDESDYQSIMASADILLVNEKPGVAGMAVPSKLTSYFSTGRPVIAATNSTGATASEIAVSSAGIVVNAGDPLALVETALELRNDSTRAEEMGRNGLHYREAILGEEAAIAHYAEYLLTLAAKRVRRPDPVSSRRNKDRRV